MLSGSGELKSSFLTLISLILLAIVFYLTDFSALPDYISNHKMTLVILLTISLSTFLLRLLRNYLLFRWKGYTECSLLSYLPRGILAGVVSIYGPLKSGELVSMEIYKEDFGVQRGQSLSIIVVGRILDIVVVLSYVSTSLLLLPRSQITQFYSYLVVLIIFLAVIIVALISQRFGTAVINFIHPLFIWKFKAVYRFLEDLSEEYYKSLSELKGRYVFAVLSLTTLGRWSLEVLSFSLLLNSFGIHLSILKIMSVLGFSYSIGVSSGTPGALGSSQLTSLSILTLFGVNTGTAALALVVSLAIGTSSSLILLGISLLWSNLLK